MNKNRARDDAKARRDAFVAGLTPAECSAAAVLLAEHVERQLGEAQIVSVYLPIGSEIDTLPLIDRLVRRGVTLALPHVTGRRAAMRFLGWTPGEALPAGPMGLRQPEADAAELHPDVILTPLLAFDTRLHRLGYGAGHYDRAFVAHPHARRIGLSWSVQRVDAIADDPWDVRLHGIATEQEFLKS